MKEYKFKLSFNNTILILLSLFFIFYTFSWIFLNTYFPKDHQFFNYFTDSYGVIAGIGGFAGFLVAHRWGGFKSLLGKSLYFFSIALLFQFLGQISYAVYFYIYHIDNPYPSFGEIFYFGSIPINILAVWLLARAVGFNASLKAIYQRVIAVVFPLLMMLGSYYLFLKDYDFTDAQPLTVFLDFGYPLGEAAFVALAILAFLFSAKALGGVLRKNVLLILFAMIAQYVADTLFLVSTINGTWYAGGTDDYLFILAYVLMGIAIIEFWRAANKLSYRK